MSAQPAGKMHLPESWHAAKVRRRVARFWLSLGLVGALLVALLPARSLALSGFARWALLLLISLWITTVLNGSAVWTSRRQQHHDGARLRRHGNEKCTFVGYRWCSPWSLSGVAVAFAVAFLALPTVIGLIAPDYGWVVYRNREVIGLACYAAILISPYVLGYLTRGRQRPGLALGTSGLRHRTWFGQRYHRWDTIDDIELSSKPSGIIVTITERTPTDDGSERAGETNRAAPHRVSNRVGGLAADPQVVQATLSHYLRHPEHRHELGQHASLERIKETTALPNEKGFDRRSDP